MSAGGSPGATPLSFEERDDLIPGHISTRAQLDAWEQRNILAAERWAFGRARVDVLSVAGLNLLHRRMFDRTWRWAGEFRRSDKNLGVPKFEIPEALTNTCADATLWLDDSVFPAAEAAVRFHHRVVWVHPFPNGNGRHARLAADVLLHSLSLPRLDWSGGSVETDGQVRAAYIDALRAADDGDFRPLVAFVGL